MSASEKLKALSFQPVVYADGDLKFRNGFSEESLRPLLTALPQIVEVVEAAERTRATHREWEHKETFENALKRDAARNNLDITLAVLDEALS